METQILIEIGLIFILLALSALFSSSETALTAASDAVMKNKEEQGIKNAKIVNNLRNKKDVLIGTILLGNNVVNILATSLTTTLFLQFLGSKGTYVATIVMTVMILIFSEILPKSYAMINANNLSLFIAPFINILVIVLSPITSLTKKITNIFLKDKDDAPTEEEEEEELRGAIDLHQYENEKFKETRNMLHSILDLEEITLDTIMTHRTNMYMIDLEDDIAEIIKQIKESKHSRIPVYKDNSSNILGILHIKNLLQRNNLESINHEFIQSILLPSWFVQEQVTVKQQLQSFKEKKEKFVMIVNEYGEMQGCATLGDILEEIIGETGEGKNKPLPGVQKQSDESYLINGNVTIRDLNRHLNWNLNDENANTIAGLVLYHIRKLPKEGHTFIFDNFKFYIVEREPHKISKIRVKKLEQ